MILRKGKSGAAVVDLQKGLNIAGANPAIKEDGVFDGNTVAALKSFQNKIPVIASGGIFTGNDAKEKLDAGASLVQVWTGFIYEGPFIVKNILSKSTVGSRKAAEEAGRL